MLDPQLEDNFFSSSPTELAPMLPDELCPPAWDFSGNGGDTFREIDSYHLQATTVELNFDLVVGFTSEFADDTSVNSELYNLDAGLKLATEQLASFAANPNFSDTITIAFGEAGASSNALELLDDLAAGKVNIEIISGINLPFGGAFGDNTVFLSEEFLSNNNNNPQAIANVVIEEFGHYLDFHLNSIDSKGDEGEIFSRLVQGLPLSEEQLINLKTENDHGIIGVDGNTIEVEFMEENEGIFTASSTGETTIDFLLDSGAYQSQLGIFSLAGMDDLARDSVEFRTEAARRVLTNSSQGYVVVSDGSQGARLDGNLEEFSHNNGDYNGTPTFILDTTAQYGLILVPNGTIQGFLDNPDGEGSLRPLFSLADANPNGTSHFASLGNGAFGIEDLRSDVNSDIDYNDIVIQVQGAQANAIALDNVIDPNREWRSSNIGQELLTVIAENAQNNVVPETNISLLNDTGIDATDLITSNPTITGNIVADNDATVTLQGSFDGQLVDITADLQDDGSFNLDLNRLEAIAGEELNDGEQSLILVATDVDTNAATTVEFDFFLDREAPDLTLTSQLTGIILTEGLAIIGVVEDTTSEVVSLSYNFDGGSPIEIEINEDGSFNQPISLDDLENSLPTLTITATDTAGNATNFSQDVTALITTDSGLQYFDFEQTDGATPTTGQLITVDYTGTLTDGTVFDSSIERGVPFQFTLGVGQVIAGWDEGLATMTVGSTRRLIIPPQLGYGAAGIADVIPPNATLIFDVELLSIDN